MQLLIQFSFQTNNTGIQLIFLKPSYGFSLVQKQCNYHFI